MMKKNLKYSLIFVIMAVVIVVMTGAINLLAGAINVKWDMTPNKMYSIGDQTHTILSGLQREVEVIMLSDKEVLKSSSMGFLVAEFLDKYDKFEKVKVSFIDPDKNPNIIKELDKAGTLALLGNEIVVRSGSKVKKITAPDIFQQDEYSGMAMFSGEQVVTGAIKYVTSENTPVVYFVDGHSARKLETEYSNLKKTFENNNYEVKKINLTVEDKIPQDAAILFFASPNLDLSLDEKNKVSDYLKNGGNAVFLFDPLNSDDRFVNFEDIFKEYNIQLNYDRVKENNPQRHVANRPYDIAPIVAPHEITNGQDLRQLKVIMPESRSFKMLRNDKDPLTVTPLLTTSDAAVGEPFGGGATEESYGPIDVALAAEYKSATTSKIVVIGNGYFVTDEAFQDYYPYSSSNMKLLGLTADWMHNKTDEVFIIPKSSVADSVTLSGLNATIVVIVSVLVFPLIITAIGITIWLRRRHL